MLLGSSRICIKYLAVNGSIITYYRLDINLFINFIQYFGTI